MQIVNFEQLFFLFEHKIDNVNRAYKQEKFVTGWMKITSGIPDEKFFGKGIFFFLHNTMILYIYNESRYFPF